MPTVPHRIVVGPDDAPTVYERAADHYLVRLEPGVEPADASGSFASAGLTAEQPPTYVEAARPTLEPGGYAWVELPTGFDSADGERALEGRDEVAAVLPVYFTEGEGPESAASPMVDTITVLLRSGADVTTAVEAIAGLGLTHDEAASALLAPHHVFHAQGDVSVEEAFALLDDVAAIDGVARAEFDWLKLQTYTAVPNDPQWANQWNMAAIDLPDGRDIETGSPNVWIAVIDSGFDLGHPDLSFTPNTGSTLTHFNADQAIAGNPPPYDASSAGVFHGTACAGIAAATTDNGVGVAGVGGGCRIMPVRLGTVPTANRVAAGLNWAATNGAAVASLSLGTTSTAAANTAVANAWAAGMVICAATGNGAGDTTSPAVNFPANHANVIAVGASDLNDQRKRPASSDGEGWGSQFDANTDLVAPGVNIWTTDEQGASGYNVDGSGITVAGVNYPSAGDAAGDYFALFNGTSSATPHVAGLAGLLRSAAPTLTNADIRDRIESTCDKVNPGMYPYANTPGRPNGTWHQEVGYGRINVRAALCAAVRSVELTTPSVVFNDIPEGEFALRAASFSVRSCEPIDLEITAGPTVTSGPGEFLAFLGTTTETVPASTSGDVGQLWFSFTGQSPGSGTTGEVEITCPQTGEVWNVTLSANSITAPAAAVVMVLDQSGSMLSDAGDGRDRIDVLKDSAPVLAGLLDTDDAVGVVAFDHDAYPRLPVTDVAAGGGVAAGGQIASHTPNSAGRTSIGDGVALARTVLDDAAISQPNKAMVVLTDGRENEPMTIASVSGAIDDKVFAIGLGAPEHLNPVALTELTNGTGGYLLVTGTLDQDDYFTLQKYYLQILAGVTTAEVVLDPEGFVAPGAVHTVPFVVNERDRHVDVVVLSPAPAALRPQLITPSGDLIDPGSASGVGGQYVVGHAFAAFRLPLPVVVGGAAAQEGAWKLCLGVNDQHFKRYLERLEQAEMGRELELALAHGLRYSANVHARSAVRMTARIHQQDPRPGSKAELVVHFTEAGRPLPDATVTVEVTRPHGGHETLELVRAGDLHRAVLPTDEIGVFRCRVLGRGRTFRGTPVDREQLATLPVWDPNRLAPDEDPPRRDREPDRDGRCEKGVAALVDILESSTPAATAIGVALRNRGHDPRQVVACVASSIGRNGHRELPVVPIDHDWRPTQRELVPDLLRDLADRLDH